MNTKKNWKGMVFWHLRNMMITVIGTLYVTIIGSVSVLLYFKLQNASMLTLMAASISWLIFNILIIGLAIHFYWRRKKEGKKNERPAEK